MTIGQLVFWSLGALVLGIGLDPDAASAASRQCANEECACEKALSANTVEALEAFLRKYPHSIDSGRSACALLAGPAQDDGFDSQNVDQGNGGQSTEPSSDFSHHG